MVQVFTAQVQYEALRDDHCFDPTGKAKSTLYCNKDAGDHGRHGVVDGVTKKIR